MFSDFEFGTSLSTSILPCNGCGMPTVDSHSSGHLVPSHFGFSYVFLVETNSFPELDYALRTSSVFSRFCFERSTLYSLWSIVSEYSLCSWKTAVLWGVIMRNALSFNKISTKTQWFMQKKFKLLLKLVFFLCWCISMQQFRNISFLSLNLPFILLLLKSLY